MSSGKSCLIQRGRIPGSRHTDKCTSISIILSNHKRSLYLLAWSAPQIRVNANKWMLFVVQRQKLRNGKEWTSRDVYTHIVIDRTQHATHQRAICAARWPWNCSVTSAWRIFQPAQIFSSPSSDDLAERETLSQSKSIFSVLDCTAELERVWIFEQYVIGGGTVWRSCNKVRGLTMKQLVPSKDRTFA